MLTEIASLMLALDYLERHYFTRYIFPIKAGAKFPPCLRDNLDTNCSNNIEQIKRWSKQFPGCNWGLAHKKSKLLVADIDTNPKKNKQGQVTYDWLDLMYGWPATEKTTTPSGGFHLIYEGWGDNPHITAYGKNGLGMDIDSPNYTLIPGCTFADGTGYVSNDAPSVKCPQWIYDTIKNAKASARIKDADEIVVDLDQPNNIELAIDFLKEDAEPAIEGRGGDITTYKTAAYLKDIGISATLAIELLNSYYNPRCEPPWDLDGLERKVASAYTYTNLSKGGGKTAEADFADDPPDDNFPPKGTYNIKKKKYEFKSDPAAAEKTREKARIREAKKPKDDRAKTKTQVLDQWVWVISMERFINRVDPKGNNERDIWNARKFDSEFNKLWFPAPKKGSASDYLTRLAKGGVTSYYRVCFKPGDTQTEDFNMYREPYIKPVAGDTAWWDEHLEYLLPDEVSRNHLLNWMAWLLQNIKKKPKHALVLQGEVNGTGKSFVSDVLTRILHPANVSVVPQNALSGRFNGWALGCKLVVIEELRASDKMAVKEALHDIITQETISVEKKGVDPIKIDNCFGVFALTNNDAAITLDNSDRRYLVIRTDRTKAEADAKAATGYFVNLFAKLDDDSAIAAVAYSLMNRDLQGYNAQAAAPFTDAKAAMMAASASDLEAWMEDNRENPPLTLRLISIDDVLEILPRTTRATRHAVKSILLKKFQGVEMGQHTVLGGRRRLIAINGSAGILRNRMPTLGALYEADKQKAGKGLPIDDDSASSDFMENPE